MGVCVFCQKGFDEDQEVQVHEKVLKALIRISDERELQELSRYLKYFYSFVNTIFFLLSIYFMKAV